MKSKQALTNEEVKAAMDKLVEQILSDEDAKGDVVIIGIITRGVTLATRISEAFKQSKGIDAQVGSLDTRPHRDDNTGQVYPDATDIPFPIEGKDVVLVDDVMSTGRTIRAALDALVAKGRPRSIKTAVLIDRGHRELPITADYVGAVVPTSVTEEIRVLLREVDGGSDRAEIVSQ